MTDLQKASLSKRIAAGMLDAMLICVLAAGIFSLLMWVFNYEGHAADLAEGYARYETQYGVDFSWDYSSLEGKEKENFDAAYAALIADNEVMRDFNLVVNQSVLITTFSILLAMVCLEFVVPLLLKNGRTLGKKAFGLGLMRVDGVRITPIQLFVRTVLGKFTLETMISVYILIMLFFQMMGITGPVVIGGILLLQAICMIVTRTNSMIHDLLAGTVVVDIGSQRIFRTAEELLAYQKEIAAERAARQEY